MTLNTFNLKHIIKNIIRDILWIIIPYGIVFLVLKYVVCMTTVMSGSMEPKLNVGSTAVYNRLAYVRQSPERGDVIFFWSDEKNEYMGKRVIGIPGDSIAFFRGRVFINNRLADESSYIAKNIETNAFKTFKVPDRSVFVMGDNRENSSDSRFWKNPYIPYSAIIGRYIGGTKFSPKYMLMHKKEIKEDTSPFHVGWDMTDVSDDIATIIIYDHSSHGFLYLTVCTSTLFVLYFIP